MQKDTKVINIFIAYSDKDKEILSELQNHIKPLEKTGRLKIWNNGLILAGSEWGTETKNAINLADIILLLISSDFLASEERLFENELKTALELHNLGKVRVIPIIVRECDWKETDLSKLKVLPTNQKPIRSNAWSNIDEACLGIVNELKIVINDVPKKEYTYKEIDNYSASFEIMKKEALYSEQLAKIIIETLYNYINLNPILFSSFLDLLPTNEHIKIRNIEELIAILEMLEKKYLLSGVEFDDEKIFIVEKRAEHSAQSHKEDKKKIAKKAFSFIKSNMIIAVDAGSTTLEVVKLIANAIARGLLENITVVTNSLPAVEELLKVIQERSIGDKSNLLHIFVIGGKVRPVSHAIVRDERISNDEFMTDFSIILNSLGLADIAFVGANGLHEKLDGFAIQNDFEIENKKEMLSHAKRKLILVDISKFKQRDKKMFATFEDNLEIITFIDSKENTKENIKNSIDEMLKGTNTIITYAK